MKWLIAWLVEHGWLLDGRPKPMYVAGKDMKFGFEREDKLVRERE